MTEPMHGSSTSTSSTNLNGPYPHYRGLWAEEDDALKQFLSRISVPIAGGKNQGVAVFFRDPLREERKTTYPYIMLQRLETRRRENEEHRGYMNWWWEGQSGNAREEMGITWWPIPVTLVYQVTVASRLLQHDTILNDILATTYLPFRFGQLTCPSGTVRRLDVLDGPRSSDLLTGENQRLFRKIWTIGISAETIRHISDTTPVGEVGVTVTQIDVSTAEQQ